jgi:hypothetical protein
VVVLPLFPIFRQFFHFHENLSSSVISGTFSVDEEDGTAKAKQKKVSGLFSKDYLHFSGATSVWRRTAT